MANVKILEHPLAGSFLLKMRDKNSSPEVFRAQVKKLGRMLALEATRDVKTQPKEVETPLCKTKEDVLVQTMAVVPILRAGLGLLEPFLDFLPEAKTYCLGMYRNEETHEPVTYYNKLDQYEMVDIIYVLDPMLATGGTSVMTIDALKNWGAKNIKFVGLVGAPEGVQALQEAHPDVEIILGTLDDHLNENAYIVPGLGDAGDRIFNS